MYVLVDTETTGIGADDKVCEVAWRHIDANLDTVEEGYSLINPGKPIHYAASAVNGITDDMVKDAPTLEDYMEQAGYPLIGEDMVFIAHNSQFDFKFLKAFVSPNARLLCTLKCARHLYPDAANHKQSTLAAMLGIYVDRAKAHAADGDVNVLHFLVRAMCAEHNLSLEDLIELSNKKREITSIPFGKHKGVPLKDVPKSYIQWLLSTAQKMDPDLKEALQAL